MSDISAQPHNGHQVKQQAQKRENAPDGDVAHPARALESFLCVVPILVIVRHPKT
jgi:hypothetical protein